MKKVLITLVALFATLALPANGDGAFTTPDIIPVTLPAEGKERRTCPQY